MEIGFPADRRDRTASQDSQVVKVSPRLHAQNTNLPTKHLTQPQISRAVLRPAGLFEEFFERAQVLLDGASVCIEFGIRDTGPAE